jgi:hypothetical protein
MIAKAANKSAVAIAANVIVHSVGGACASQNTSPKTKHARAKIA